MKILKVLALILGISFLAIACGSGGGGGGGSSAPPSESAVGHWGGTFYSNTTQTTYSVFAMVSEDGIIRVINYDNGFVYGGIGSVNGDKISSTLTGYASSGNTFPDGSVVASINIEGTVSTRGAMSLTYNGANDSGDIIVSYLEDSHERGSSISMVSGQWTVYGTSDTITVDSNGNMSGSVLGCSISGEISIINSSYNTYRVNVTASNCGGFNGTYDGLADIWDYNNPNDSLEVVISTSTTSISMDLIR